MVNLISLEESAYSTGWFEGCEPQPNAPYVDFWVQLAFTGGDDLDPEIIEVINDASWWAYEQDNWESTLLSSHWITLTAEQRKFTISNQDWALREGIAPGQPFLVRMHRPIYSTDYWGESDCDCDTEILSIKPMEPAEVLRLWEEHFEAQKLYIAESSQHMKDLREKQLTDFDAMYLKFDVYYSRNASYFDEMSPPDGYRCLLLSKHLGYTSSQMASGESDTGDIKEAMDRMVSNAIKAVPGLTEERILAFPKMGYR